MLKEIALITITVANLSQVETAWQEHFDYKTLERGVVSDALAEHWHAPDMAGDNYILMQPANKAANYVRMIEDEAASDYRPMTSHGWNATELLVKDPDNLAAGMADSHFNVIGEPRDLWSAPNAPRVMQALGPGNELLYLTRNNDAAAALGFDASTPAVERAFIMVVGGPSMASFQEFYGEQMGLTVSEPNPFKITMISKANALPIDTSYPLAVVNLSPGYLLEVDELPATIEPRTVAAGRLPTGVAVVSFTVDDALIDRFDWVSAPHVIKEFPYAGRRVGLMRGPAGELIEVIEMD